MDNKHQIAEEAARQLLTFRVDDFHKVIDRFHAKRVILGAVEKAYDNGYEDCRSAWKADRAAHASGEKPRHQVASVWSQAHSSEPWTNDVVQRLYDIGAWSAIAAAHNSTLIQEAELDALENEAQASELEAAHERYIDDLNKEP